MDAAFNTNQIHQIIKNLKPVGKTVALHSLTVRMRVESTNASRFLTSFSLRNNTKMLAQS